MRLSLGGGLGLVGAGRGEARVDVGESGGQGGDVGFEDGDAGLDFGLVRGQVFEFGFAQEVVDGGPDHGGDAAVAADGAELAETFVFLVGETEADHSTAGFRVHRFIYRDRPDGFSAEGWETGVYLEAIGAVFNFAQATALFVTGGIAL